MIRHAVCLAVAIAAILASSVGAQIWLYGTSLPSGFTGVFDTSGQLPFVGNPYFKLSLHGHANPNGGAIGLAFGPGNTPVGAAVIYLNLSGLVLIDMPPGVTELLTPVPNVPSIVGFGGAAQFAVADPALIGGFGLTDAVIVQGMPNVTPTRAFIPGQDFSQGTSGAGQMCVLDLTTTPPAFRATGSAGFAGTSGVNFPNKIAVARLQHVAYALGNGTTNQFIRAFNVASDPTGVVTWAAIGDIPTAGATGVFPGALDMEVTEDGHYVFALTGTTNVTLDVFDTHTAPASLPSTPVQSITFANAGSGAAGLELSPNGDRLVAMMSVDSQPTLTIYQINSFGSPVLTPLWYLTLGAFAGVNNPADVHFSQDGRLLFVSGPNGFFNVIDTTASPPTILVGLGSWPATPGNAWFHGSAVAMQHGAPVGILGTEGTNGSYFLVDLNTTSATFGTVIGSFTTNAGGNVSNHRMHARQNIVVAIDEAGSVNDAEWVDVIDLDHAIPGGYQSWRVKMPSPASLTPVGITCIPRDFGIY